MTRVMVKIFINTVQTQLCISSVPLLVHACPQTISGMLTIWTSDQARLPNEFEHIMVLVSLSTFDIEVKRKKQFMMYICM